MGRQTGSHSVEQNEESYTFEDSYFEQNSSAQLGDDWDTMMDEFLDDYEDFSDVDFPARDDDF